MSPAETLRSKSLIVKESLRVYATRFTHLENRLKDKGLGGPRLSKDSDGFDLAIIEETRLFAPCKEPVERCVHLVGVYVRKPKR